jgi:hypothetical protein
MSTDLTNNNYNSLPINLFNDFIDDENVVG